MLCINFTVIFWKAIKYYIILLWNISEVWYIYFHNIIYMGILIIKNVWITHLKNTYIDFDYFIMTDELKWRFQNFHIIYLIILTVEIFVFKVLITLEPPSTNKIWKLLHVRLQKQNYIIHVILAYMLRKQLAYNY